MKEQETSKNPDSGEQMPGLTRRDLVSGCDVRWCPGCGDYSILSQVQGVLPKLGIPREKFVFISGIGCSSRFPYYMNTYGMHGIHGRAMAIASGLKICRPDLSVWVVTGDGDALAIGGNHFLHTLRRNVDLNILLFNNRIYGLTKGQYSPTSVVTQKTKSSPQGVIDYPLNPICVALASECTFVARSLDSSPKHLAEVLERAAQHKGTSFVEIYQNCNIFNDGAYDMFSARDVRDDNTIILEHGKPLIFGKNRDKGIRMNGVTLEVVEIKSEEDKKSLLVHDEKNPNPAVAYFFSQMNYPDYPVPLGIFRAVEKMSYGEMLDAQIAEAQSRIKPDIQAALAGPETWQVG